MNSRTKIILTKKKSKIIMRKSMIFKEGLTLFTKDRIDISRKLWRS
jgi:hypothetical protein